MVVWKIRQNISCAEFNFSSMGFVEITKCITFEFCPRDELITFITFWKSFVTEEHDDKKQYFAFESLVQISSARGWIWSAEGLISSGKPYRWQTIERLMEDESSQRRRKPTRGSVEEKFRTYQRFLESLFPRANVPASPGDINMACRER